MNRAQRRQVMLVLFCHFTAALAALGMPPFFGLILADSLGVSAGFVIGWCYVVPTVCTALTSPWWGRFADRFGKKVSLLRAQLGLALGFGLASLADSLWMFVLALVVQGVFGGTFAASNAYLSTFVRGEALARCLNLMQGSARAAMVAAPVLFGFLVMQLRPLSLYGYLALLPLLAALLLWWAPATLQPQAETAPESPRAEEPPSGNRPWPFGWLYGLQFGFAFCTVVTFPYFVSFAQQIGASTLQAGLLFSLPHLVYLLSVWAIARLTESMSAIHVIAAGLGLLVLALPVQAVAADWIQLIPGRVVMGAAMTLCFIGLHRLVSSALVSRRSGRLFGSLDSGSKWAGVAAGLVAGLASVPLGLTAPFWLGAASAALTLLALALLLSFRNTTTTLAKE
ncbi:MFS transporter [Marinobacter sp. SS21]|uniref:MFS transporter n=1 Tax=Marinobacter sp. SS21 TaxID=2979460 RepID=UPI00232B18FE|nr:MFS transporter [Marinobacter sp. SS21]MDC0661664.1 MFS transporter [Marinobacter sp. SS21]